MPEMQVVGKHCVSVGGRELVTGSGRFTSDLRFPGMLVGNILYSSHPCARIKKLDVKSARSLPGVHAVITHNDIPGENTYCHVVPDQPVLVSDYVRFQGEALAAVAADDENAALAAIEAIEVEYEPRVGVFDPLEAMKPDAPRVWPDRENIFAHWTIEHGDIEAGFRESDVVIENTFSTQFVEHAYLETEGAVAKMNDDGTINVYSSCQAPHGIRRQVEPFGTLFRAEPFGQ